MGLAPHRLVLPLTLHEQEILRAIRAAGGFPSDLEVVRSAIWLYGQHFGLRLPVDVFLGCSPRRRRKKTRTP